MILPVRILNLSVLQICHHLQCTLRKLTSSLFFFNRNIVYFSFIIERCYRANNASSSCSERLIYSIFLSCLNQILYFEFLHGNFELVQILHQFNHTHPCDTRENCSIKWRCYKLVFTLFIFPEDEKVHGSDFSYIIMEEPQCLVTTIFFCALSACSNSRSIIATNFPITKSIWPSSNYASIAKQFQWHKSSRIVGSDWTQNNERFALSYS